MKLRILLAGLTILLTGTALLAQVTGDVNGHAQSGAGQQLARSPAPVPTPAPTAMLRTLD